VILLLLLHSVASALKVLREQEVKVAGRGHHLSLLLLALLIFLLLLPLFVRCLLCVKFLTQLLRLGKLFICRMEEILF